MRSTRKRDVELERLRQAQNELVQRRNERREVYAEWLSGFGRLLDVATRGQLAEYGPSLSALSHVGDAIQLIASTQVEQAVRAELAALRRIEARVTDLAEIIAEAARMHEKTLEAMRLDIG